MRDMDSYVEIVGLTRHTFTLSQHYTIVVPFVLMLPRTRLFCCFINHAWCDKLPRCRCIHFSKSGWSIFAGTEIKGKTSHPFGLTKIYDPQKLQWHLQGAPVTWWTHLYFLHSKKLDVTTKESAAATWPKTLPCCVSVSVYANAE